MDFIDLDHAIQDDAKESISSALPITQDFRSDSIILPDSDDEDENQNFVPSRYHHDNYIIDETEQCSILMRKDSSKTKSPCVRQEEERSLRKYSVVGNGADLEASATTLYEIFHGQYDKKQIRTALELADNDADLVYRELEQIGQMEVKNSFDVKKDHQESIGENPEQRTEFPHDTSAYARAGSPAYTPRKRKGYRTMSEESGNAADTKKPKASFSIQEPEYYHDNNDDYGIDNNTEVEKYGIEPAGQWLMKYFPGGSLSTILLGKNAVIRDTIPKIALCSISPFFQAHFAAISAGRKADEPVKMFDLCPDMFDLAIQHAVTRKINLEPNCQRRRIDDITILIDLVHLCLKYQFPDPSEVVEKTLHAKLIQKRSLLKNIHIRKIYDLPKNNTLKKLAAKAVVQHFMKTNKSKQDEEPAYESDDDEELREGEVVEKYNHSFRYEKTLLGNRDFEYDVLREMKQVDSSAIVKPVIRGGRILRKERQAFFVDPLNGAEQWSSEWAGRSEL